MYSQANAQLNENTKSHPLLGDRGQAREIFEKQEKYLKGKVVSFQSLTLHQYLVDLLTFLELS